MNESDPNNPYKGPQNPNQNPYNGNQGQNFNQPNFNNPYNSVGQPNSGQYPGQPYNPYPNQQNSGQYPGQPYPGQFPNQQYPGQYPGQNYGNQPGSNSKKMYLILAAIAVIIVAVVGVGIAVFSNSNKTSTSSNSQTSSNQFQNETNSANSTSTNTSNSNPSSNTNISVGDCYKATGASSLVPAQCSDPASTYKVFSTTTDYSQCKSGGFIKKTDGKSYCLSLNLVQNQCYLGMEKTGSLIQIANCSDPKSARVFKIFQGSINGDDCKDFSDEKPYMYYYTKIPSYMACIWAN